ncbi:lipoyl synthase [Chloroflexota bacterium]
MPGFSILPSDEHLLRSSIITTPSRHPKWLRKKVPSQPILKEMELLLDELSLHTVCQSAQCPNIGECFSRQTATFLIMGDVCTRNCTYCAITKGKGSPLNPNEPYNIARAVGRLNLKHVVITSVTRDDLPSGGAVHFATTIKVIRRYNPLSTIEVLIPDFEGSPDSLKTIIDSSPEVLNHNVETVPRLYSQVRPKANYHRSLNLLRAAKTINQKILTKSGLMLGMGEEHNEVVAAMEDLYAAQCDFLTIGQYLSPSYGHHPVTSYVTPEQFQEYESIGKRMGFRSVTSGPFVRSSFEARETLDSSYTTLLS